MDRAPDDDSRRRAASLRPWLRWAWRLAGVDLAIAALCAGALFAKDAGRLGGYRGAGTGVFVESLFVAGPFLALPALALVAMGVAGRVRVGGGHGFGWSIVGGACLLPISGAATLLAVGLVGAAGR